MIGRIIKIVVIIGTGIWLFSASRAYMTKTASDRQREQEEKATIGSTHIQNPRVKEIQQILSSGKYYSGAIDGIMGKETRSAVRKFQRTQGLPETGLVDSKTFSALSRQASGGHKAEQKNRLLYSKGEEKKGLKKGSLSQNSVEVKKREPAATKTVESMDQIRKIQSALKNAGFYGGNIDGKAGKGTRMAIKEFQLSKKLKADGIVGEKTWKELRHFLRE